MFYPFDLRLGEKGKYYIATNHFDEGLNLKQCNKCKRFLPETEFRLRKKGKKKLHNQCKECCKQYYYENKEKLLEKQKEYNNRNKEKNKKRKKEWYNKNRERILKREKERMKTIRTDVLSHYSNETMKCALCGCDDIDILDIDHINGGGCKQRRDMNFKNSDQLFRWLIKNNYPPEFRVLCKNCNWKEGLSTRFPHRIYEEDKYGNIDSNFKRKVIALQIYSNGTMKCALCGCDDIDILCIDHINGGGYAHKKKYNSPIVRWLRKNKYPNGFRVLCLNCNWKVKDLRKEKNE